MIILRLCCLCLCMTSLWSASALLDQAQQQQGQAEMALEQARKHILQSRQVLLQQLADEQKQLTTVRQQHRELSNQRQQLEQLQQQRDLQAREQREHYQLRIERACASLSIPVFQGSDPQGFKQYLLEAVNGTLAQLDQAQLIRSEEKNIANRNGDNVTATVIHCGAVQQLALSNEAAHSGFLLTNDQLAVVNGPLLNAEQHDALKTLAQQQYGIMIADLDGSLVKQAVIDESWAAWLAKGGLFIWPILAVGVIAAILAAERFLFLSRLQSQPQLSEQVSALLAQNQEAQALAAVEAQTTPLQRILYVGIIKRGLTLESREAALEAVLVQEESLLDRSRPLLAVLAAIAPLLGLLGTVTGMIATFQSIALFGTANPQLLSNGISEALITTQMGLLVAVPILLVIGIINRMADKQRVLLEQGAGLILSTEKQQESSDDSD